MTLTATDANELTPLAYLPSISEESDASYDDHTSPVEFDLLEDPNSLGIMNISNQVSPYFSFKFPLGSVHSVFVSQFISSNNPDLSTSISFNLIVDSGCTQHMFPSHHSSRWPWSLTFPKFLLPVDYSYDCTIQGVSCST
jgi:hypothetical protein